MFWWTACGWVIHCTVLLIDSFYFSCLDLSTHHCRKWVDDDFSKFMVQVWLSPDVILWKTVVFLKGAASYHNSQSSSQIHVSDWGTSSCFLIVYHMSYFPHQVSAGCAVSVLWSFAWIYHNLIFLKLSVKINLLLLLLYLFQCTEHIQWKQFYI